MSYKALIIDDNQMQIKSLLTYVTWETFGIGEVKIAHNGKDGLKIFEEFTPDIIITDVVMPGMTGIEIAEKIREITDKVKIIFISCYEDFGYLKKAMEHDAVSYVLKPLQPETLANAITKAIEKIENEKRRDTLEDLFKESMEMYRKNFFYKLIYSGYLSNEYIENTIHNLKFDNYRMFVFVKIDVFCSRFIDIYNILNLTEKIMFSDIDGMAVVENEERIVAMFMGNTGEKDDFSEMVCSVMENYRSYVNTEFKVSLNIGISEVHCNLNEASTMLEEATNALEANLSFDKDGVRVYDDLICENSEYNILDLKNVLNSMLYDGSADSINNFIEKYCSDKKNTNLYSFKTFCMQVFVLLQLILNERNLLSDSVLSVFSEIWNKINRFNNPNSMKLWFEESVKSIVEHIQIKSEEAYDIIVRSINEIIEKDYSNIKNVGEIASRLFISESYARRLYKQHTGKTIFEKLFVTKMENAKYYLTIEKMPTQQVYLMVGYKSKTAFLEAFKKYTGFLPTDYIESLNIKE